VDFGHGYINDRTLELEIARKEKGKRGTEQHKREENTKRSGELKT